jgi:hypothetical protein
MFGGYSMKGCHHSSRLFDVGGYGGSEKLGIWIVVSCVPLYLHLRKQPSKVLYRVWEAPYVLFASTVLPSVFVVYRPIDVPPRALSFLWTY